LFTVSLRSFPQARWTSAHAYSRSRYARHNARRCVVVGDREFIVFLIGVVSIDLLDVPA
jgi:hypothetical protein